MAYQYSPRAVVDDEEELKRRPVQPAATLPTPGANADPFKRNTTAVEGNTETRYGAVAPVPTTNLQPIAQSTVQTQPGPVLEVGTTGRVAPTRAATPDAFARPGQSPNLLVPSPAAAEVPPPSGPRVVSPGPSVEIGTTSTVNGPLTRSPLATGAAAVGAAAVAPAVPAAIDGDVSVAAAPPAVTPTPFPGTLPGATPLPTAQPVAPRPIIEDEEDAFRRRRAVA